MNHRWFENLTGFPERDYHATRDRLAVSPGTLRSKVNGREFAIGELTRPSLADLRHQAAAHLDALVGTPTISIAVGDVGVMHREPANHGALFQVASQFNLLEMTSPGITPEAGVTRYASDRTQGPACAVAAGAATIYRNYFADVDGSIGQTSERQIDCLRDVGDALGNGDKSLWTMRNGYALCTEEGLARIDASLRERGESGRAALRDRLRIGIHSGAEVTSPAPTGIRVTQAFCSALPVSYTPVPAPAWASFATLILEGAYEATLWAAVINTARTGNRTVFLTQLGGGAFGNDTAWIHHAMRRAAGVVRGVALDIRIVSYRQPDEALARLVSTLRAPAGP
jgi:hypothetical protein